MIQIHVNPARVEKVIFSSMSEMEGDFDFAAWVAIRPLVAKIDRKLKALTQSVLTPTPPSRPDRG